MLLKLDDETYLIDEILNFEHVPSNWFVALLKCFQTLPMLGFLVSVQWIHEEIDFPIAYA
jgi:hypothetical protein